MYVNYEFLNGNVYFVIYVARKIVSVRASIEAAHFHIFFAFSIAACAGA